MGKRYHSVRALLLGGLLLCLAFLEAVPAKAQDAAPTFEVDAISLRPDASSQLTQLDIYTRVPYANLSFIAGNGFTARYEVTAQVYQLDDRNRRESLVQTSVWERTATTDLYALTTSAQTFDHTTHTLELAPGRYMLEVQLTDQNAEASFVSEMPVEVRDLSGPMTLSDIILLEDYDRETQTIFPRVSETIESDQFRLNLFYEIYADQPQQVRITREIIPIQKRGGSPLIRAGRTLLGLRQPEEQVAVLWTGTETSSFQRGRFQMVTEIPLDKFLEVGDYMVRVRLENMQGQVMSEVERTFSVQWSGLMAHISNIDEAIQQLEYIAKPKDLNAIKNAPEGERVRRFETFWDKYDPTPGTPRNERMEEYYYRIAYANQRYSSGTPGWKTDRGHVLVRFGEPDRVEASPFSFDTEPYEVWYYYRIGRKLLFIDKTGFGDYELYLPIWDERNRIR